LRKLGIIGGMSWSSTALYYEHINRGISQRLGGLHCAELAIESVDFAGIAAMEAAGDWEASRRSSWMRRSTAGKRGRGHRYRLQYGSQCYDAVAANVDVPVFHIGDATADRLVADGCKRVALLGTRFTMLEPHVRSRLESRGITLVPIEEAWIREVDRIIFEELAAGRIVRDSQRKLKTLITELAKQKVQAVVLGCTELVLAVDVRANVLPVYDTTAIHARACIDWMLADQEPARAAA
jgi:aspartate racemase